MACLAAGSEEWRYGYELLAETGLKSGSLYPILMRMAERELLEAAWEPDPPARRRPPQHLYRLTSAGREWLHCRRLLVVSAAPCWCGWRRQHDRGNRRAVSSPPAAIVCDAVAAPSDGVAALVLRGEVRRTGAIRGNGSGSRPCSPSTTPIDDPRVPATVRSRLSSRDAVLSVARRDLDGQADRWGHRRRRRRCCGPCGPLAWFATPGFSWLAVDRCRDGRYRGQLSLATRRSACGLASSDLPAIRKGRAWLASFACDCHRMVGRTLQRRHLLGDSRRPRNSGRAVVGAGVARSEHYR